MGIKLGSSRFWVYFVSFLLLCLRDATFKHCNYWVHISTLWLLHFTYSNDLIINAIYVAQ